MHTWSAEQVRTFLEYTADHRLHAAFVLLATTGMRRGEALGLRWSDLDLTAGRLSITRTVIAVNHVIQIGSPKTARARRTVALDPGTIAVLRKHRQQQLEERLLMGSGFTDHDLLFCRPDGGPLHPERFARTFQIEATRAGLPRIRLHDLRHTWATLALVAGEHPKVVQERLGHANVSITLEIYIATSPRACMAPLPTASLASSSAPPEGAKKAPVANRLQTGALPRWKPYK
jgi:integrase